ncbi:uncharacterized protein TNCT_376881 [Trichonephila clavata]|uniref:Uncharacterized protein n=1 Tax=Trichonephila clavata TaxID=2740835 RepID=A0A8X6FA86_TRICU|nr:uncharacterized protein TNCT_376881 [Trichonephila clavata]
MTSELQSTIDDIEIILSTNSQLYSEIDNIWMISHVMQLPDVPMWVGFNSRIYKNDSLQQLISYLTPINASPTNTSIFLETMEQSKKIAEDLHQRCIQRFLLPFINKCIAIIPSTEIPGNFLRVIVSLMVAIKAGRFENIFNHSLALYLSTILQTMITWYRTSINQCFQDQVLEVCLSIAMNCNSEVIMSHVQSILTPVVYALYRNNSDLVLKALKVLQAICNLDNEFINSHFLSLRIELVHGLHHALKIPSDETKEIIFQLLIQFHDHWQNLQIQQFLMQH